MRYEQAMMLPLGVSMPTTDACLEFKKQSYPPNASTPGSTSSNPHPKEKKRWDRPLNFPRELLTNCI